MTQHLAYSSDKWHSAFFQNRCWLVFLSIKELCRHYCSSPLLTCYFLLSSSFSSFFLVFFSLFLALTLGHSWSMASMANWWVVCLHMCFAGGGSHHPISNSRKVRWKEPKGWEGMRWEENGGGGGGGLGGRRRRIGWMNPFTWQDEGERKLASLIQLATLGSPFILPPSSPLCPLSSFTFTLHPAGVGLVASDGWRGCVAVYRLRGLEVSLVCKVASAVWCNMVCSLVTKFSLQRWHICLGDMGV